MGTKCRFLDLNLEKIDTSAQRGQKIWTEISQESACKWQLMHEKLLNLINS